MNAKLRHLLEKAGAWPLAAQEELAAIAGEMDALVRGEPYVASADELAAIDEADRSGVADPGELETVFANMRRE